MTRIETQQDPQPSWAICWASFALTGISSLVIALGLWHIAGVLGHSDAYAGQEIPLRLEVGQSQPLAEVQPSQTQIGGDTTIELSFRVPSQATRDVIPPSVVKDTSPSLAVTPDEPEEIWIEESHPEKKTLDGRYQTAPSEAAGEVWLEEDQAAGESPIVTKVPAPSRPYPVVAETKPSAAPASTETCRILLGNDETTSLRVKRPYVIYPTGRMIAAQPVAKEPPLPSPWKDSLIIPENTPDVIRKVRESLELNQTLTVGSMDAIFARSQPRKSLLHVQAELSPEPVRHNDVTLTSAESEATPAPRPKSPPGEAVITGWDFPARVSEPSRPRTPQLTTISADVPTYQRNQLPENESTWKLIPIEKPVGSPESQSHPAGQARAALNETASTSSQTVTREGEKDVRTVRPVVTSDETPVSEGTSIKVTEFANQSIPAPRAALVAQESVSQAQQGLVEVVPGGSQVEEPSFEIIEESGELTVVVRRSKLLRTKVDVYRTAVVDSAVCDVVQFTPREISILGKSQGATHVTFWFQDERYRPITYLVRVVPDPEVEKQQSERYELLESHLAKLFPESKVDLVVVGDKLIVRGQARDAAEAAQIMAIIRGELVRARGVMEGQASDPIGREAAGQVLPAIQVINMLRIPGPPQVALKVKIAELNRSAARNFGVDMKLNFDQGKFLIQSLLNLSSGGSASILGNFDGGDLKFGLHYLEEHGVIRMLSEPTLITLSGRPATFIAGGEFAVPTTVGVNGVGAVTTDFRAYGAIITFLPTVLDKDLIRLEVAPEFSQLDTKNKVNGTPGLRTRAVTTTVEMREGQTLAIAGLLDDSMTGNNQGDLPIFNQIFGRRSVSRNETELIILVTPELVHPMEPEEVPPLPGFDVTEPTNHEFYLKGHLEGRPTQEYDSTTWPRLRRRYNAGGPAKISGPFGHGD